MKVAVYGAGATGGYLGIKLARSGVDATLIARGAHLEAMRARGARLVAEGRTWTARPFCTDDPAEVGAQDVVIMAMKAHSALEVVDAMQPLLGPETVVVTAQNGFPWWYFFKSGGPWEGRWLESVDPGGRQWRGIGPERAIGCVVHAANEIESPGVVRHLYGNRFALGEPSGERSARVRAVSRMFVRAGVRAPVRSIREELWLKLWGNVCFNPISALTLATLDRIASQPGTQAVARAMMRETEEIANALGIEFRDGMDRRIQATAEVGAHRTSMLQDLQAGRALEIDPLLTSVQELGALVGAPTPTIDVVAALVRQRAEVAGLRRGAEPKRV